MQTIDITIRPNEKYRRIIGGYTGEHEPETDYEEWPEDHQEAANDYTEAMDSAPSTDDLDMDEDHVKELTWDMISVSSDPDLVSKMATYFEGMAPHESTARLRAKLRLLPVFKYAEVQWSARNELRDD